MTNTQIQIEEYKKQVKDEFYKQLVEKIETKTVFKCTYYNDKIWIYKKNRNVEIQVFGMSLMTVYRFKGEAYSGEKFSEVAHNTAEKKLYKLLLEEEIAMKQKGQEMFEKIEDFLKRVELSKATN